MRAIIYLRVSTDAQVREGTSLETQERECIDYAQAKGWTVTGIFRDVASGVRLSGRGSSRCVTCRVMAPATC